MFNKIMSSAATAHQLIFPSISENLYSFSVFSSSFTIIFYDACGKNWQLVCWQSILATIGRTFNYYKLIVSSGMTILLIFTFWLDCKLLFVTRTSSSAFIPPNIMESLFQLFCYSVTAVVVQGNRMIILKKKKKKAKNKEKRKKNQTCA